MLKQKKGLESQVCQSGVKKVGTILLTKPLSELEVAQDEPHSKSTMTERRDVFCSPDKYHGEPYYLSHTGNKVLVLHRSRIDYFPDGVEPKEDDLGYQDRAPIFALKPPSESESDEDETPPPQEEDDIPILVGTIMLKMGERGYEGAKYGEKAPYHSDFGSEKSRETEEERQVYASRRSRFEPYYLTQTGNRVLVVDSSRIRRFPGEESLIKKEELRRSEEQAERDREAEEERKKRKAEKRRKKMLREALAQHMESEDTGDDVKIGTIVVQKKLGPGERLTCAKEILDVYYHPKEEEDSDEEEIKPYMVTSKKKKVFVANKADIRYFSLEVKKKVEQQSQTDKNPGSDE